MNSIELYAEGEVNGGGYKYRDVKRRGIYLSLFTDPEGDSCFSIYQISLIKMKKRHFTRNFADNLQTFLGYHHGHFYDFVANSSRK